MNIQHATANGEAVASIAVVPRDASNRTLPDSVVRIDIGGEGVEVVEHPEAPDSSGWWRVKATSTVPGAKAVRIEIDGREFSSSAWSTVSFWGAVTVTPNWLETEGLVVRNGDEELEVRGTDRLTFAAPMQEGLEYDVTIARHPEGQRCRVRKGKGVVGPVPAHVLLYCSAAVERVFTSSNSGHGFVLRPDGELWGFGKNDKGQVGDGKTAAGAAPTKVLDDVVFAAASQMRSFALKKDGTVWGWGDNSNGYIGDGSKAHQHSPVQVDTTARFVSMTAGNFYAVAIDEEGRLWSWGDNARGTLGRDGVTTKPVRIEAATGPFVQVSAGRSFTLALDAEGRVWSWGTNEYGELGNWEPSSTHGRRAIEQVLVGHTFKSISTGPHHALAVDMRGRVWAWGKNEYGQLGNGSTTSTHDPVPLNLDVAVETVVAGGHSSHAIDEHGMLWSWGNNVSGQFGLTSPNSSKPVKVELPFEMVDFTAGLTTSYALIEDDIAVSWGYAANGRSGFGANGLQQLF